MARIRSKSAHLIAVAVGAALVLMPLPPLVASAHLSAGRVAQPKMSQPRLQRVGTANVRQLATQAAAGGGLSSNLESEAGPWIDFEREGSAAPIGAGAPAPGNTAAVVNQNLLGWEGLTHADQRLHVQEAQAVGQDGFLEAAVQAHGARRSGAGLELA